MKSNVPARLPTFASIVEGVLWRSRLLMIFPVVGSLLLAFAAIGVATVNVVLLLVRVVVALQSYSDTSTGADPTKDFLAGAIGTLDIYLLSAILFIFGLGLYELFIGKIEEAEKSPNSSRVLVIRTLDDLKDRLAKVAILALIIEFLREALRLHYDTVLDLLYLAAGILAIGVAIYLAMRETPRREP